MRTRTRKTRTTVILLALALVAFGTAVVLTWSPREPVYQGRTVDAWLDEMLAGVYRGTALTNCTEYRAALHQFGPQAVPFIIRKLEQNDSPWRNKYRDVWSRLPGQLQKLLPKPTRPRALNASLAGWALDSCGTNATGLIIGKLNAGNPAVREAAWMAVAQFFGRGSITTNDFISLCLPALQDRNAWIRQLAAASLGHLGAAASNAVPALVPLLTNSNEAGRIFGGRMFVRANTAQALGEIGPAASPAIPALTNLLATGDRYDRVAAAFALWHITSNENLALPVIMQELPTYNKNTKELPIGVLAAMGPRAKAAFPLLLSELPLAQDNSQRAAIVKALKTIDPEAADKAGVQ